MSAPLTTEADGTLAEVARVVRECRQGMGRMLDRLDDLDQAEDRTKGDLPC
jgi:hypothetical protein